ncbi:MAG: PDZ domain-containing protein [Actinobacteria bacterium]|nr:PDZ domain-containing protein [Actinomycetota bacterium]
MPQQDATDVRPALTSLGGECLEPHHHLFGERLVLDVGDAGDTLGVVADQSAEQRDRTAVGSSHPFGRDGDIEHMLGAGDPGVDFGRRDGHAVMVVGAAVPDAWHPTSVLGMAPPDSPDDDIFGSHPHPDDRLWRHPSETGPATPSAIPSSSGPTGAAAQLTSTARRGRSVTLPLVLIALVLGSGLTLVGLSVGGAFDPPPARIVIERVESDAGDPAPVETVVERLRPSIVQITVTRAGATTAATGVIYRSDGYVITTASAVSDADSIRVTLSDGRNLAAQLVGTDPVDDVAVVRIDTPEVTPVVLGDPDALAAGSSAIALSVDGGVSSPTAVIETIAANGLRFDAADGATLHDMISARGTSGSFDDAILCAPNGAVLGIFTTRAPEQGDPNGAAGVDAGTRFATPIDFAVRIADDLVATGTVQQAWLGVTSEDLDSVTSARLGRSGTVLTEIAPGGPAEIAGLRPGDIIVSIDGAPITSATSLVVLLRTREIGATTSVAYIRDGVQRTTMATLMHRP